MPRGCRLPRRAAELVVAGMIGAFAVLLLERFVRNVDPEIFVGVSDKTGTRIPAATRPRTKLLREVLRR